MSLLRDPLAFGAFQEKGVRANTMNVPAWRGFSRYPHPWAKFRAVAWLLSLAALTLALPGCGGRPGPSVPIYPTEGKVLVGGQPAAGALIVLWARPERTPPICPNATVAEDGSFRLTSFAKNDGAPAGEYAVTVVWSPTTRVDGETYEEPDRLKGRYSNPNTSGLQATIKTGKNALPTFELTN